MFYERVLFIVLMYLSLFSYLCTIIDFQFCNMQNEVILMSCLMKLRHSQQVTFMLQVFEYWNVFNCRSTSSEQITAFNKSVQFLNKYGFINEGPCVIETANLLLYIPVKSKDKVFVKQEDVKVIYWNVQIISCLNYLTHLQMMFKYDVKVIFIILNYVTNIKNLKKKTNQSV